MARPIAAHPCASPASLIKATPFPNNSLVKLYWFQSDIPALKGLTSQQREAAKRPVISLVWRH